MKGYKDESVLSLLISPIKKTVSFAIWVGESNDRKKWEKYRFDAISSSANIFKVKFPAGREMICNIGRGVTVEVGKPFSFFARGKGSVALTKIRRIVVRRKKSVPPPMPKDA